MNKEQLPNIINIFESLKDHHDFDNIWQIIIKNIDYNEIIEKNRYKENLVDYLIKYLPDNVLKKTINENFLNKKLSFMFFILHNKFDSLEKFLELHFDNSIEKNKNYSNNKIYNLNLNEIIDDFFHYSYDYFNNYIDNNKDLEQITLKFKKIHDFNNKLINFVKKEKNSNSEKKGVINIVKKFDNIIKIYLFFNDDKVELKNEDLIKSFNVLKEEKKINHFLKFLAINEKATINLFNYKIDFESVIYDMLIKEVFNNSINKLLPYSNYSSLNLVNKIILENIEINKKSVRTLNQCIDIFCKKNNFNKDDYFNNLIKNQITSTEVINLKINNLIYLKKNIDANSILLNNLIDSYFMFFEFLKKEDIKIFNKIVKQNCIEKKIYFNNADVLEVNENYFNLNNFFKKNNLENNYIQKNIFNEIKNNNINVAEVSEQIYLWLNKFYKNIDDNNNFYKNSEKYNIAYIQATIEKIVLNNNINHVSKNKTKNINKI